MKLNFILVYADDAVFFAKSAQTLQIMLNKLHTYSNEWGLKINTDKTKVMVFEKGLPTDANIYYDNIELEVEDSFNYLGKWQLEQNAKNLGRIWIACLL